MPGRISSPALIGRGRQLDALRAATAGLATDPRRVALVHGEAGIGKTRLLDEFARSVNDDPVGDRPVLIVRGACLDLGGGDLPYAPILDILDDLAGHAATDDESTALRMLRDELGGAGEADRPSPGRGRIFVAIRDHLVRAAHGSDVIVVVDDLHWADRSTLELLSFLASRLAAARVLVVLSYRSDEIPRRHPLRAVLAELERGGVAADVSLEPLGRADVRDQLGAIFGTPPDTQSLERIVSLADGNPFHVEELAALDREARDLPRSLRDTLLARLERLDDPTLEVLGRAAVIGRDVDERLLVAVSDRPAGDVRAALRQAIDSHVLEPAADRLRHRFRHALLRQAVLDDILPSEGITLHRRVAEALEERPELAADSPATAAAELAYHWSEAADPGRAFPALMEAGRRSQAAHAWTDASEAFERAATLATAGAGSLEPIDLAELWMGSAQLANFAGDLLRGLALGRTAIAADDGADPRRSGVILIALGTTANDAGDFDTSVWANERAVELVPADPPSLERADAVAGLAARRMIANRSIEAIDLADEAIASYRTIDARAGLGAVLVTRAMAVAALGRVDETRTAVNEALRLYDEMGDDELYDAGTIACNAGYAFFCIGDFERVESFVDEAMARAVEIGAERGWAIWLESTVATTAFVTGRWDVAAERLGRFRADAEAGFPGMDASLIEAELAAGRGDRSRVDQLLSGDVEPPPHDWYAGQFARVRAVAALWDGDAQTAARLMEPVISMMASQEEVVSLPDILKVAVSAYADIAEARRADRDVAGAAAAAARASELLVTVGALVDGTYLDGADSTPWMRAIATQVTAENGRAQGHSDAVAWASAVTAHAAIGTVPEVAYCRYRQGEALLAGDDRGTAAIVLQEALAIAHRVGIVPLIGWIEALARRSRLSIDGPPLAEVEVRPDAAPDPWRLSPREREVLGLLGEGRTNRQIGETLFISEKTASVHVTHILGKLGVSSRTEAALLAGRSGVREQQLADDGPSA